MPKHKILVIFAHPRFENSRVNKALVKAASELLNITFQDLYQLYPDFNIDIEAQKQLLTEHDIIIWHHPFYWYSAPPLLKQWIDMVLEYGWAYGPGGTALSGKILFNTITSGGPRHVYSHEGHNRHTFREFLYPFEQTALLCKMTYLPPFAVQGTHKLTESEIEESAVRYKKILNYLSENLIPADLKDLQYLNDFLTD